MTGRSLVLRRSQQTGQPVRVLYRVWHENRWLIRYEGWFQVTEYYVATGKAGFQVILFRLLPCPS